MAGVVLVQFSDLDLKSFLPACRQATGRKMSASADAKGHTPPLHHMICVAAMKNEDAGPRDCIQYKQFFQAGFLVVADSRDMPEILEVASMPSVLVDTIDRDLSMAFVTGTLSQWRDALVRGCSKSTSRTTRKIFTAVYSKFKSIGVASIFDLKSTTHSVDNTLLLEG